MLFDQEIISQISIHNLTFSLFESRFTVCDDRTGGRDESWKAALPFSFTFDLFTNPCIRQK